MKKLVIRLINKLLYKKTVRLVMKCDDGHFPQPFFRRKYRQFISFQSSIFGETTRVKIMTIPTFEGLHVHYFLLKCNYPSFEGDATKYVVISSKPRWLFVRNRLKRIFSNEVM